MPFAFPGMYHDVFIKEHNVLQLHASLSKMNDLLAVSPEDVVRLNSKDAPRAQDKVRDLPVGNLQRSLVSEVRTRRTALQAPRCSILSKPQSTFFLPNSDGFGDACQCLRRTPMNPHVKCKLWRFQCRKKTAWLPCFQFAAKLIERYQWCVLM
ncbi:uncharacterized protein LOC119185959 isoform X1 [Rhipicephalus microplus]|uniref:uncharacterized protein LOC119185959 isoform X1 n=1 Tax=Rhipicephalus microplus TaxID=6941 RepID=UPI003F6D30A8